MVVCTTESMVQYSCDLYYIGMVNYIKYTHTHIYIYIYIVLNNCTCTKKDSTVFSLSSVECISDSK